MSAFSNREVCPKCDNDYSISKVGERRYCEDCGWQGGADEVGSREAYTGPIDLSHLRCGAGFWDEKDEDQSQLAFCPKCGSDNCLKTPRGGPSGMSEVYDCFDCMTATRVGQGIEGQYLENETDLMMYPEDALHSVIMFYQQNPDVNGSISEETDGILNNGGYYVEGLQEWAKRKGKDKGEWKESKVAKRLGNLFKGSGFWDEPDLNQTTMVPLCERCGNSLEAIWTDHGPLPYCPQCAGGWRTEAITNDQEVQRATEMWFSNPPYDWMKDLVNEEDPEMGYRKARALASFMHEYRPGEIADMIREVDRWKDSALSEVHESDAAYHEPDYSRIVAYIGEVPYADNPEEAEVMWREGKMADWGYPYVEGEDFDFDRWCYEQQDADQEWSMAALDILLDTDPEFNTACALADALRYP
jgi:hypothetical protein